MLLGGGHFATRTSQKQPNEFQPPTRQSIRSISVMISRKARPVGISGKPPDINASLRGEKKNNVMVLLFQLPLNPLFYQRTWRHIAGVYALDVNEQTGGSVSSAVPGFASGPAWLPGLPSLAGRGTGSAGSAGSAPAAAGWSKWSEVS